MSDNSQITAFTLLTNPVYLNSAKYHEVVHYFEKKRSPEIILFIEAIYNKLDSFQTKEELKAAFACFRPKGQNGLSLSYENMMSVVAPLDSEAHTLEDVKKAFLLSSDFIRAIKKDLNQDFLSRHRFDVLPMVPQKKSSGFFSCFGCSSEDASAQSPSTPHNPKNKKIKK